MKTLIVGFILGVMVATVGFGGITRMFDNGVQKVQEYSKEAAK